MKTEFDASEQTCLSGMFDKVRWRAFLEDNDPERSRYLESRLQFLADRFIGVTSAGAQGSDLARLNGAEPDVWLDVSPIFADTIALALAVGEASEGAFEIGVGDILEAWGFGCKKTDPAHIAALLRSTTRTSARDLLELDVANCRIRKHGSICITLDGIAKGMAADLLASSLRESGITAGAIEIGGDLRIFNQNSGSASWLIGIDEPDYCICSAHSYLDIARGGVATSGDYGRWIEFAHRKLSHTIDPKNKGPLVDGPASVTVLAENCAAADAWATALMVLDKQRGQELVQKNGMRAVFLNRDGGRAIHAVSRPQGAMTLRTYAVRY